MRNPKFLAKAKRCSGLRRIAAIIITLTNRRYQEQRASSVFSNAERHQETASALFEPP